MAAAAAAEKPIVTVLGATGAQGGSVVDHLLKSGKFRVRAVTRKVGEEKAKRLAAEGAEVVEGDFNNKSSLVKAFSGSWAIFAMSQFWDPEVMKSEGKIELEQGQRVLEAAEEAKISFAVVSVLEDTDKASGGRVRVPHFTIKAHIEQLWRKSKIPTAFVLVGTYLQNTDSYFKPRLGSDGVMEFVSCVRADVGLPWVDVTDTGLVVRTLFENPKEWTGKRVDISGGYYTWPQIAEIWSRVHGKASRYVQLPYDVARPLMGNELVQMFHYFNECGYFLGRDLSENRKRWPALKDPEWYFRAKTAQ